MAKLFGFLLHYIRPLWRWYLGGLITLGLTTYVALEIPESAREIVNSFSVSMDVEGLASLALFIVLLGAIQVIIRSLSRMLFFWPGRKIEAEIKNDLFTKLIYLPYQFYLTHGLGGVVSRIANDVNHLRVMVAFGMLQLLNVIFLLVFILSKMIEVHGLLTFLCLLPMGLMIFVARLLMPQIHKCSKHNQEALGDLTNLVTEAYSNIHVIQSNSANEGFLKKIREKTFNVYNSNIKLIKIQTVLFPLMALSTGISKLAVLLYGGYEVINGRFTVGDILAFSIYIGILVFPLTAIGILISIYQQALAALERIDEIFDEECESGDLERNSYNKSQPLLSIKNLSHRFSEDDAFSLKNISFDVNHGEKVAIWGKIGSGKTTLFHLINKLHQPPEGAIFWNGGDIFHLDIKSYRQEIGYALQTAYVFSNSVEKNIGLGAEGLGRESIRDAAKKAMIYDDIEAFADGWETQVGEKGVRLSGGQKQRLSLARTLLRGTPLIILDDVLSAVDQSTEKKLIETIFSDKQAVLISSHRSSILEKVDRVIVLEQGVILDSGSYSKMAEKFPGIKSGRGREGL